MLWTRIKQFFCKHDYERVPLAGLLVVDGWFHPVYILRCKKCGKERRV